MFEAKNTTAEVYGV